MLLAFRALQALLDFPADLTIGMVFYDRAANAGAFLQ
jgi:hypothetical protein